MTSVSTIEGIDLVRFVQERGPLPAAEACDLIRQAALELQHVHDSGLVHGDVEPDHLFVTHIPEAEADPAALPGLLPVPPSLYGVVKLRGVGSAAEEGRNARSDLYGLGCAFYHLLTGRSALEGLPLVELRPDLPDSVAAVVRRLMARDAADGYRSAGEVAVRLAAFVTAQPLPDAQSRGARLAWWAGAAGIILVVVAWGFLQFGPARSDGAGNRIGRAEIIGRGQPDEVLLRSLPTETAGVVGLEMRPLLARPWLKDRLMPLLPQSPGKHLESVRARIDRLAVAFAADDRTADVWTVQGRFEAAALQHPKSGPPFLGVLAANAVVLSDHRATVQAVLAREAGRPAALGRFAELRPMLREREPDEALWLALHADFLNRLPGPANSILGRDWDTLKRCAAAVHGGLTVDAEVRLRLVVVVRGGEDARAVERVLNRYLGLARLSPHWLAAASEELIPLLPLLCTGRVSVSDREVVLRCNMGLERLDAAIDDLKRSPTP